MVHMCKMIISLGVFFSFHFFKILIFWFHRGVKEQKTVQNDKNVCHTQYLRYYTSYDYHLWCKYVNAESHLRAKNGPKG